MDNGTERPRPKLRRGVVRGIVIGLVIAVAVVSAIFGTGMGTLSSLGIGAVAYLCPVGALESMFGSFAFVPRLLMGLAAVIILTLVVGRSFCGWACPIPPLRSFFGTKKAKQREAEEMARAAEVAAEHYEDGTCPARKGKPDIDSRHVVLCGALGTAAVFGFPVFCLVCPIGLTFAVVVGLVRLIGFNEPSFSLLLFAVILAVELIFLRKWCSKFCPIGAFLSLVSHANRTFRPKADAGKCLRTTEGNPCGVCATVCPEHIDPQSDLGERGLNECTRCGKCADACPASALSFPLLARRESGCERIEAPTTEETVEVVEGDGIPSK